MRGFTAKIIKSINVQDKDDGERYSFAETCEWVAREPDPDACEQRWYPAW